MIYFIFLAISSIMGSNLHKEIDKLLEEKGYINKNRFERVKRASSGNNIVYSVTSDDVRNWFKKNIWYFLPVFHFIPIIAFCVRHILYEDKSEEFFHDWLEFLINIGDVIPCSEDEFENVHEIEEELTSLRSEKTKELLSKIGMVVNVDGTIEEQDDELEEQEEILETLEDSQELESKEDEELEQPSNNSSIEITISTPMGSKKFYRVIESRKHGSSEKSKEDEELDKIMDCLDRVFDRADQRIDKAMDKVDQAMDKVDVELDHAMDGVDAAIDKVDKALEKILKL